MGLYLRPPTPTSARQFALKRAGLWLGRLLDPHGKNLRHARLGSQHQLNAGELPSPTRPDGFDGSRKALGVCQSRGPAVRGKVLPGVFPPQHPLNIVSVMRHKGLVRNREAHKLNEFSRTCHNGVFTPGAAPRSFKSSRVDCCRVLASGQPVFAPSHPGSRGEEKAERASSGQPDLAKEGKHPILHVVPAVKNLRPNTKLKPQPLGRARCLWPRPFCLAGERRAIRDIGAMQPAPLRVQ